MTTDNIIPGRTFNRKITTAPSSSDLQDGEILVEVLYISLDHAMRGWMSGTNRPVLPSTISPLIEFCQDRRNAAAFSPPKARRPRRAISFPPRNPKTCFLSPVSLPHAWVGLTRIGDPKSGELVDVSGAAGATGSVASQKAKLKGATDVGICGSDEKCNWLTNELDFDIGLNYKAVDIQEKFNKTTKSYIDVYFNNVGDDILDMALGRAKERARFIECGFISVFDYVSDFPQARKELAGWLAEGKLKKSEHILKGGLQVIEEGPVSLYKGTNTGKLLVEVKNPDDPPQSCKRNFDIAMHHARVEG
ncbi:NAD(P)-binding protein [Aspergillus udagawae]|nr:NAD(P)-binding protein [Aspergillus udagawae]